MAIFEIYIPQSLTPVQLLDSSEPQFPICEADNSTSIEEWWYWLNLKRYKWYLEQWVAHIKPFIVSSYYCYYYYFLWKWQRIFQMKTMEEISHGLSFRIITYNLLKIIWRFKVEISIFAIKMSLKSAFIAVV